MQPDFLALMTMSKESSLLVTKSIIFGNSTTEEDIKIISSAYKRIPQYLPFIKHPNFFVT